MNIESNFKIEEIKCNRCNYPNKVAFQQYNFMAKDDECVNKLKEENEKLKNDLITGTWKQQYDEVCKIVGDKNRQIASLENDLRKHVSMERYVNAVSENGKLKEENETLKYRLEFMNNQANSVNSTFHKALDDARTLKEENEKLKAEIFKSESNEVAYKTYIEQLKAENEQLKGQGSEWMRMRLIQNGIENENNRLIKDNIKLYEENEQLKAQLQPTQKTYKCATCRDYKRVVYVGSSWIGKDPFKDCPDCCKKESQPKKKVYKCNTCYDTKISVTYQFISDEYVLSRCPDCYKKEAKPQQDNPCFNCHGEGSTPCIACMKDTEHEEYPV
jgi:hypothetical protein